MPLFAILLWLAGDRFLPRCLAQLSLPQFANVDFVILFTANLPWCAIGLPMAKCSTFVRVVHSIHPFCTLLIYKLSIPA